MTLLSFFFAHHLIVKTKNVPWKEEINSAITEKKSGKRRRRRRITNTTAITTEQLNYTNDNNKAIKLFDKCKTYASEYG